MLSLVKVRSFIFWLASSATSFFVALLNSGGVKSKSIATSPRASRNVVLVFGKRPIGWTPTGCVATDVYDPFSIL